MMSGSKHRRLLRSLPFRTLPLLLAGSMVGTAVALAPGVASAQGFFSLAPSGQTAASTVSGAYQAWKKTYLVSGGGNQLRIQRSSNDGYDTVSEGIAYGMLFAAYQNDKTTFDGLWSYSRAHSDGNGLMHWRLNPGGSPTGYGSATDADLDTAAALIAADKRWGGYTSAARNLIKTIKAVDIEVGSNVVKPGDSWGGSQTMNPSYLSPAYFTVFAQYTSDGSWYDVREASYRVLAAIRNGDAGQTGFTPDWSTAYGGPANGQSYNYGYDGSRLPLRLAMASAWDGSAAATGFLDLLNSTDERLNLNSLASAYSLRGYPVAHGDGTPLLAAAAAAATVSDNASLRSDSWQALVGATDTGYFADSMRLFGLLVASGTMVSPLALSGGASAPVSSPTANASYSLSGASTTSPAGSVSSTSVQVRASAATRDVIVDLEVYDASGNRLVQKFYGDQDLAAGTTAYSLAFTPPKTGSYTIRGGIFTSGWVSALTWNPSVATVTATAGGSSTGSTGAGNVSIWWPSNGANVHGVQPFKAVLDDADLGDAEFDYKMSWQVDGGTLSPMANNTSGGAHKQADIDVSRWTWQPSGRYTITFVATNASGAVLAQKSTTITVGH